MDLPRRHFLALGTGAATVAAASTQTAAAAPAHRGNRYRWRNVEIVGGGFVTGIVHHPAQRGLVYVRTDIGGAARLDQRTQRWVQLLEWVGFEDWSLTGVESLALDPRDPRGSILPSAPTPTTGRRSTGRSCVRAIRAGRSNVPSCPSNWAATSRAARWASGSPSTRATAGSCTSAPATRACGAAPIAASPGPGWTASPPPVRRGSGWASSSSTRAVRGAAGRPRRSTSASRTARHRCTAVTTRARPGQPLAGQPTGLAAASRRARSGRLPLRHLRRPPRAVRDVRRCRPQTRHRHRSLDRHHAVAAEHRR